MEKGTKRTEEKAGNNKKVIAEDTTAKDCKKVKREYTLMEMLTGSYKFRESPGCSL